jgi:hypothetical protein
MHKKIAGALGAVATLATMDASQAATAPTENPAQILKASSFGDLLKPIPNAAGSLAALDAMGAATQSPQALGSKMQLAYHHHHHHHHHRYRRHHHHHHHHHHHRRY